jgi:ribonuclease D
MVPELIGTDTALQDIVAAVTGAEAIGVDTEFVWERTYFPLLGLVQIGVTEKDCFLIDTLAVSDLRPLGAILADPAVVKIIHDAHQDLVILHRATGAYPRSVFDTQRAAGFIGMGSAVSLGNLVRRLCRVSLTKTETRTDWLKRPLSKRQIAYALDDVRYLPAVREKIYARVNERGFTGWLDEEMAAYDVQALYQERDARQQFLRVKGGKNFSALELAVLRELAEWREETARAENVPREHLVPDKALVHFAQVKPSSISRLRPSRDISAGIIQRYGQAIVDAVARGVATPSGQRPSPARACAEDEALNARVDFAMAYVKGVCIERGIDQGLVGSRAEIAEFIGLCRAPDAQNHRLLHGWRKEFIGAKLQKLLSGAHALRMNPASGLPQLSPD